MKRVYIIIFFFSAINFCVKSLAQKLEENTRDLNVMETTTSDAAHGMRLMPENMEIPPQVQIHMDTILIRMGHNDFIQYSINVHNTTNINCWLWCDFQKRGDDTTDILFRRYFKNRHNRDFSLFGILYEANVEVSKNRELFFDFLKVLPPGKSFSFTLFDDLIDSKCNSGTIISTFKNMICTIPESEMDRLFHGIEDLQVWRLDVPYSNLTIPMSQLCELLNKGVE